MGFNTDGIGFLASLREKGVSLQGRKVLLIGAGGAARAVAFVVALQEVARLTVLNRTPQKARRLAQELSSFKPEIEVRTASYDLDLALVISDSNLIINATSAGMKDHPGIPIPTDDIDQYHIVYDLVYWPLRTELLRRSEERGAQVISGLEMLIHQGAESFRIWTGKEFPIPIVREELTEYLKSIEDSNR
jgi:shikimate dehydrogenase